MYYVKETERKRLQNNGWREIEDVHISWDEIDDIACAMIWDKKHVISAVSIRHVFGSSNKNCESVANEDEYQITSET